MVATWDETFGYFCHVGDLEDLERLGIRMQNINQLTESRLYSQDTYFVRVPDEGDRNLIRLVLGVVTIPENMYVR